MNILVHLLAHVITEEDERRALHDVFGQRLALVVPREILGDFEQPLHEHLREVVEFVDGLDGDTSRPVLLVHGAAYVPGQRSGLVKSTFFVR